MYPVAADIIEEYRPDGNSELVKIRPTKDMILANSETLNVVTQTFGHATTSTILVMFLRDMAKFYGLYDKVDANVICSIADSIIVTYGFLKLSEVVLFFHLMKIGHFRDKNDENLSKMFGKFGGDVILDCLYKFNQERRSVIEEAEHREKAERLKEMRKNSTPPPPGLIENLIKQFNKK